MNQLTDNLSLDPQLKEILSSFGRIFGLAADILNQKAVDIRSQKSKLQVINEKLDYLADQLRQAKRNRFDFKKKEIDELSTQLQQKKDEFDQQQEHIDQLNQLFQSLQQVNTHVANTVQPLLLQAAKKVKQLVMTNEEINLKLKKRAAKKRNPPKKWSDKIKRVTDFLQELFQRNEKLQASTEVEPKKNYMDFAKSRWSGPQKEAIRNNLFPSDKDWQLMVQDGTADVVSLQSVTFGGPCEFNFKLSNGLQSELQINAKAESYELDGSRIRQVKTYCWNTPDKGLVGIEFFDKNGHSLLQVGNIFELSDVAIECDEQVKKLTQLDNYIDEVTELDIDERIVGFRSQVFGLGYPGAHLHFQFRIAQLTLFGRELEIERLKKLQA